MAKVSTQQKHGSVGPSTFQSTRYGTIERLRVRPLDPNTHWQQVHREIVLCVARQWRHLTDAERTGWSALAPQLAGQLTGQQVHNKVNVVLAKCGLPVLQAAPPVPAFGALACAGLVVEDTPRLQLTQVSGAAGADKLVVEACEPQYPSIGFIKNLFRFVTAVAVPGAGPADLDLTAAYVARFGAPEAGQRVFVRLTPMKNGFKGAPVQVSAIVAERGKL